MDDGSGSTASRITAFLGGPIQVLSRDPLLLARLEGAVQAIVHAFRSNAMQVFSAHLAEDFGATTFEWQPHSIAKRDLMWMRSCDVFVALLPPDQGGSLARSDGTHVELGWASALGKPIVLVSDTKLEGQFSQLVTGLPAIAQVWRADFFEVMDDPDILVRLISEILATAAVQTESAEMDLSQQLEPVP